MGRLLEIFDAVEASLPLGREHPLKVELRVALVDLNRWLNKRHMNNDSPADTSPQFASRFQDWYEREDAFRQLFNPEGCALGVEGPCLIPAECQACQ
jgi:hypothetical protein